MNQFKTNATILATCIVLFSIYSGQMIAQDTWKLLNRLSFHQAMWTTATSEDGKHAVAAGRYGRIYVTSDSGDTWSARGIDIYETLTNASYFSDSGLVLVGESGRVYRTDNHFKDWQSVTVSTDDLLTGVRAINERSIIATGASGAIYRSSNAGRSWSRVFSADAPLRAVAHASEGRFLAAGDRGTVFMSKDSGLTWQRASALVPDSIQLQRVCHVVDSIWMIAGAPSYLAQSADDGGSWIRRRPNAGTPDRYFEAQAMAFTDHGHGVLIDNNWYAPSATTLFTLDSGRTWREGQCASDNLSMTEKLSMKDLAFFPNSLRGIMAGTNNRVSIIGLRPEVWFWPYVYERQIKVSDFLEDASLDQWPLFNVPTDSNTYLWCLGGQSVNRVVEYSGSDDRPLKTWIQSDSTGWRTTDGYQQWVYSSACKLGSSTMHILADSISGPTFDRVKHGHVISTWDGGQTWVHTDVAGASEMQKFLWRSSTSGLIQMQYLRQLALTSDAGRSWELASLPDGYRKLNLEAVSQDGSSFIATGMRIGEQGADLLRSTNGRDWTVVVPNLPTGNRVYRDGRLMVIVDSLKTYHCRISDDGSSAVISDGSASSGAGGASENSLCFANNILVSVRDNGRVFTSADSGISFTGPISSSCLEYMERVDRRPLSTLFSRGSKVYFGKQSNHVICGTVDRTTSSVSEALDIFTNPPYPNPFASATRIRVSWHFNVAPQSLSLKIYNQFGSEVCDLTTQLRDKIDNLASVISWNAEDLPNGMYFVVCRSGREVSSQKLILSR